MNPTGYGAGDGAPLEFVVPRGDDGFVGMFVRRAADGKGDVPARKVTAVWDWTAVKGVKKNLENAQMRAFGIEMAYVAEGPFCLGSGGTKELNMFHAYTRDDQDNPLYRVTSAGAIPTGRQKGKLWAKGIAPPDHGEIPAAFPNGYAAFYCMKWPYFTQDRGDSLEFKTEQRHKEDYRGSTEYRLVWDQRLGCVLNCTSHFAMPEPKGIEFNNLLAGGIAESRDDHKRWQKTMRGWLPDGRISFVHHNPVNIPVDDVQSGGFVGFVTEEEMNPFVEMLDTSVPVFFATCSEWYDQHIVMKAPQAKEADGLYHLRARYRLLSVPGLVARDLEAMAVVRDAATGESSKAGFLQNKVNDFETFVPHGQVYNGPIWQHINATEGPAHSGKRSIAVHGPGPGRVKAASPIGGGPPIYGESSKRYRLAAWVKTQGLHDGGAYLQVDDVFFNWQDVQATRKTKKLAGKQDWTRLEVEFTPSPRDPLLLIKLCVEGTGTAWFDDLELMEVAR